jgi:biotin carboxylase
VTNAPDVQVILLGRQPFRCRWAGIELAPGHERHLVVDRGILDRLDAFDLAEGFSTVHAVEKVTAESAGAVIDRLRALGHHITAIATNDEYLLGDCARLQQRNGLTGPSPADIAVFTDKMAMKEAVLQAGLRAPSGMALDPDDAAADPEGLARRIEEMCGVPVVLKPRSSANSLDVTVVRTADELVGRCRVLRRSDLIAEAFIPGRVLFCDSLVSDSVNGRTTLMTAAYVHPPLGFRAGSCHGSRTLPDGQLAAAVQAFTDRVLDALPTLTDRVTHLEVLEHDGELWFLEVAARAPGAEVARCGELHLGINLEELNFRLQLGLPWGVASPPRGQVAWMWYPKRDGIVLARRVPDLASPATLTWQVAVGDRVHGAGRSPSNRREDAALIVVAGPSDPATLEADFGRLAAFEPVVYGEAAPAVHAERVGHA